MSRRLETHEADYQIDRAPGITDELSQAVESLEKQVAAIAEMLRPVCRNEPHELASDHDVLAMVSPMRDVLNRIIAATSRLVQMRESCEL